MNIIIVINETKSYCNSCKLSLNSFHSRIGFLINLYVYVLLTYSSCQLSILHAPSNENKPHKSKYSLKHSFSVKAVLMQTACVTVDKYTWRFQKARFEWMTLRFTLLQNFKPITHCMVTKYGEYSRGKCRVPMPLFTSEITLMERFAFILCITMQLW